MLKLLEVEFVSKNTKSLKKGKLEESNDNLHNP